MAQGDKDKELSFLFLTFVGHPHLPDNALQGD